MKLSRRVLAAILLVSVSTQVFAQAVPYSTSAGVVSVGPAKGIPYYAVAGNKIVGGNVLTFDETTDILTAPNIYSNGPTLTLGTFEFGFYNPFITIDIASGVTSTLPLIGFNGVTANALRPPGCVQLAPLVFSSLGVPETITFGLPCSLSASYSFNMPTTAGVAGQVLTSGGGGLASNTWTTPGSGTVSPGTLGQFTTYAATGSTVSGLTGVANGVAITNGSNVATIATTLPTLVQGNITSFGAVTSGSLDNVPIGITTASTGRFTTLTATAVADGCGTWTSGVAGSTGIACSTASGTVNAGTINQMTWYATSGTAVSGLPTLASGILNTSAGGVPSITASPTISGTMTAGGFSGPLEGTVGAVTALSGRFSSITDTALPGNSIPFANGSGTLGSSSDLLFDGTTFFTNAARVRSLILSSVAGTGTVTHIPSPTNFVPYTVMEPTLIGSAGQPILSSGSGASPQTYGALSGAGGTFATSTGIPSNGCGTWSSGNIGSTGVTCGVGTVNAGTTGQMAWYVTNGNAVSGLPTLASGILNTDGAGLPSITASPTISGTFTAGGFSGPLNGTVGLTTPLAGAFTSVVSPLVTGGTTAASTLTLRSTSVSGSSDFISFLTGNSLERARIDNVGNLIMGRGDSTTTPVSGLIRGPNAAGTDIAGADIALNGGRGTGTGAGGRILFGAAASGVSGATPNNIFTKMNITGAGVGVGTVSATALFQLAAGSTAANTAPLKFVSGPVTTVPESGAVEFDGSDYFVTSAATRKTIQAGSMGAVFASTLTTANTVVGSVNAAFSESYISDTELKLTSSANTVIISFNGTLVGATTLSVQCTTGSFLTNSFANIIANAGGTVTCPANTIDIKITGLITFISPGVFSINARTTAGTVPLLNGSYFSYTHL